MAKKIIGMLAALATIGLPVAVSALPQSALAQTQGMTRRDDRRETRQVSREVKRDCKSETDKSRAECRQTKRDVKQEGRQTPGGPSNQTPR